MNSMNMNNLNNLKQNNKKPSPQPWDYIYIYNTLLIFLFCFVFCCWVHTSDPHQLSQHLHNVSESALSDEVFNISAFKKVRSPPFECDGTRFSENRATILIDTDLDEEVTRGKRVGREVKFNSIRIISDETIV